MSRCVGTVALQRNLFATSVVGAGAVRRSMTLVCGTAERPDQEEPVHSCPSPVPRWRALGTGLAAALSADPRRRSRHGVAGRRHRSVRRRRPAGSRRRDRGRTGARRSARVTGPAWPRLRQRLAALVAPVAGVDARQLAHRVEPHRSRAHDGPVVRADAARGAVPAPGDTPGQGFDCSGFTSWAWSQAGVSLAPPVRPADPGCGLDRARAGAARRPPLLPRSRDDGPRHRCPPWSTRRTRATSSRSRHGRASPRSRPATRCG